MTPLVSVSYQSKLSQLQLLTWLTSLCWFTASDHSFASHESSPMTSWTSSQHGNWVLRVNVPKTESECHHYFKTWVQKLSLHHFCIPLVKAVTQTTQIQVKNIETPIHDEQNVKCVATINIQFKNSFHVSKHKDNKRMLHEIALV